MDQIITHPVYLQRSDVATILNCSILTISNREKKGIYPEPLRDSANNYRKYTLIDVFNLQMITYGKIFLSPIVSVLFDAGYKNMAALDIYIREQLEAYHISKFGGAGKLDAEKLIAKVSDVTTT
jgi:hypothetical protein